MIAYLGIFSCRCSVSNRAGQKENTKLDNHSSLKLIFSYIGGERSLE
jgi:hypothetical protein